MYIALEGIDGAGKSTVAQALYVKLLQENIPTVITREPGGTSFGNQVRALILEHAGTLNPTAEFLLFAADRAQHIQEVVRPALEKNIWVISDRTKDSSLVYQGYARGISLEKIQDTNTWATDNIAPDITIYLRLSVEQARKRQRTRTGQTTVYEKEKEEFFEKLVTGFDQLYANRSDVLILDATEPVSTIVHIILEKIRLP